MHPEVEMSKPGNCPKCGMTLKKKTIKVNTPKKTVKTTTLKSPATKKSVITTESSAVNKEAQEVVKDETIEAHNHSEMNMSNSDASKAEQKVMYSCPMHPEVQSGKPGKCPKCGMTLIKKTIQDTKPESSSSNGTKQEGSTDLADEKVSGKLNL
ncbi:hypothetical protein SAE01_18310 [Segetibacter aerophilus]|uniref:Heavy metal binding domain-containing protein n=2 Tax=Segetibacter aerophilus TaxID=670293 RepID=A0A512BBR3_9BACT|nr:hypothetical protein SAE01_18310 [Segetibacter aerophilus]